MINFDIQRLSDDNKHLIDGFSCVETDEMLAGLVWISKESLSAGSIGL